jgi:hypothetical protein
MLHHALTQQYRQLKTNRDVFLLHRIFPRTTSEPKALTSQIKKHNECWKGLNCEIEDLLGNDLIDLFLEKYPDALRMPPLELNGRRHYELTDTGKWRLEKFANTNADFNEVINLVEILKSLRFYLGLPADGVK